MTKVQTLVPTNRHSLHSKVKALGVILTGEFGISFRFFDAAGGQEVSLADVDGGTAAQPEYESSIVRQIGLAGQCRVQRLDDSNNHLTLVIFEVDRPILVALGVMRSLVGAGPERPRELEQVQKWLQAFGDRLRLNDLCVSQRRAGEEQAAQLKRAWKMVLALSDAIRHLRVYNAPDAVRKTLLKTARTFLDVESVLWVPAQPNLPPQVEGDSCSAAADCRHLAELLSRQGDADPRKPIIWNSDSAPIGANRFPQLRNLLAFAVNDQGKTGWVIALNKQGPQQSRTDGGHVFRQTDAVMLAPFAALCELQLRSSQRYQELKGLLVGLTRSLTSALDAKDAYTFGHSERVARIAVELGQELGLQEDELNDIYLAGLLHDIGKIGIPDALLCKAGPLDAPEMEQLKKHVTIGYHILADLQPLRNILPGVLHHHERMDGKGYPHGLAGEKIPMLARILAVADSFDAMSTKRAYRNALEPGDVKVILRKGVGTQWDERIVEAFFRCWERVHLIRQRGVGQSLCNALETALRTGDSVRLDGSPLQVSHT